MRRTDPQDAQWFSRTASTPTSVKTKSKTARLPWQSTALLGCTQQTPVHMHTVCARRAEVHRGALPTRGECFGKQKVRGMSRRRYRKSLWSRCLGNTAGCSPDSPLLTRDPVLETNESLPKPWQQLFKLKLQPSCSGSRESGTDVCLLWRSGQGSLQAVCTQGIAPGGL